MMLTYLGRIEPVEVLLTLQELSARLGVGGLDCHLARINLLKF
jgi:hypothetical protein